MTKRHHYSNRGWCTPQKEAAGLGACTVILVIVILAGVGVFSPHKSAPVPFYDDASQLRWHYPLRTDYSDATGHTTGALLNTSTTPPCTPSFVSGAGGWLSPCAGVGQAVVLSPPMALTVPFTFSVWAVPMVALNTTALLGSNLGAGPITSTNVLVADGGSGGVVDVAFAGVIVYSGPVRFARGVATHVVICADETTGFAIYANGTLKAAGAIPDMPSPGTAALPMLLGNFVISDDPEDDFSFQGVLRAARLFTRSLAAGEVVELYAADGGV